MRIARPTSTADVTNEASEATGADRREAHRIMVELEVDCESEENYLFAYIADISATGIFIRTTTPEAPGTLMNLRFGSEAEDLELAAEVIWVNPFRPGQSDNLHPGMGARFVRLTDETRDRLQQLIRRIAYLSP